LSNINYLIEYGIFITNATKVRIYSESSKLFGNDISIWTAEKA